ncbi:MAG: energy transducer TonB [Bacteroidales bacterium]|nr:energy transducer TonB [Bacteroidales bacterium]
MNNHEKKDKILGITGTLIFHIAIILILFFTKLLSPATDEGGGILVAYGTNYEIVTAPPAGYTPPKVVSSTEEITQDSDEQTIASEEEEKKKREEEQRREAERKAKEEAERKEAERINSLVSGIFSSSSSTDGAESKGSPNGNSEDGAESGNAGYGIWDLGGRGFAKGEKLPIPEYDRSNVEGKLVVNITVSPAGKVIAASTNPKLSDPSVASSEYIRNRAESAAKRAKFESIKGTNNQNGTITYFFKIR